MFDGVRQTWNECLVGRTHCTFTPGFIAIGAPFDGVLRTLGLIRPAEKNSVVGRRGDGVQNPHWRVYVD